MQAHAPLFYYFLQISKYNHFLITPSTHPPFCSYFVHHLPTPQGSQNTQVNTGKKHTLTKHSIFWPKLSISLSNGFKWQMTTQSHYFGPINKVYAHRFLGHNHLLAFLDLNPLKVFFSLIFKTENLCNFSSISSLFPLN